MKINLLFITCGVLILSTLTVNSQRSGYAALTSSGTDSESPKGSPQFSQDIKEGMGSTHNHRDGALTTQQRDSKAPKDVDEEQELVDEIIRNLATLKDKTVSEGAELTTQQRDSKAPKDVDEEQELVDEIIRNLATL